MNTLEASLIFQDLIESLQFFLVSALGAFLLGQFLEISIAAFDVLFILLKIIQDSLALLTQILATSVQAGLLEIQFGVPLHEAIGTDRFTAKAVTRDRSAAAPGSARPFASLAHSRAISPKMCAYVTYSCRALSGSA